MPDYARIASIGAEAITSSDAGARVGLLAREILTFYVAPSGNAGALGAEVIATPDPEARLGFLAFELIAFLDADLERLQGLTLQPGADLQGTTSLGRPLR